MGQIDGQFVIVAGHASSLRDAAATRIKAEGAEVVTVEPTAAAVEAAARKAGRLDALVNVLRPGNEWKLVVEDNSAAMQDALGQVAAFADTMRAAYPWLRQSKGRIANVCSYYGATAFAGLSENVAADAALQGLTRAAGVEMARDDIRVNCVVPGAMDVPELRAFRQEHAAEVARREKALALHRFGDPVEDFGGALMMLLSDEWCFMVGHPVYADGGQHIAAALIEPRSPSFAPAG